MRFSLLSLAGWVPLLLLSLAILSCSRSSPCLLWVSALVCIAGSSTSTNKQGRGEAAKSSRLSAFMSVKIYFGVPGSGKTTHAASVVYKNLKKGFPTYSNVPIKGAYLFDTKQLGRVKISDCDLIIDEASIDFNNRKFKSMPQETIQFLKYYRHYGIRDIYVYSQSYDDMDITLRRLATQIYIVKKSMLPYLFVTRQIAVKIGIDDTSHQIIDQYFFKLFSLRYYIGALYFGMFDSWTTPPLPEWSFHAEGVAVPDKAFFRQLRRSSWWSLRPRFRLLSSLVACVLRLFERSDKMQRGGRRIS